MKRAREITNLLLGISSVFGCVSLSTGQQTPTPPPGINYEKVALLRWYSAIQTGATFATGAWANGLAFDGASIWVANSDSNTVTKLRASDGATLATYNTGYEPFAVAFDGANIWVTIYGGSSVTKMRTSDGAILGTFATGPCPDAIAFDGANMWVANYGGSGNTVTKLHGANLGTYRVGSGAVGVAFDGANIWVSNLFDGTVSKL